MVHLANRCSALTKGNRRCKNANKAGHNTCSKHLNATVEFPKGKQASKHIKPRIVYQANNNYFLRSKGPAPHQPTLDQLQRQRRDDLVNLRRGLQQPAPQPAPLAPQPAPLVPQPAPLAPQAAPLAPQPAPLVPQPAPLVPQPAPLVPQLAPQACPRQPRQPSPQPGPSRYNTPPRPLRPVLFTPTNPVLNRGFLSYSSSD